MTDFLPIPSLIVELDVIITNIIYNLLHVVFFNPIHKTYHAFLFVKLTFEMSIAHRQQH